MKNNRGFTLIELLAVIVVLAIVMVMATSTILPYMSTAREDAFRMDATSAVDAASDALNLYYLGEVKIPVSGSGSSCIDTTAKKACFNIDALIDTALLDADKGTFEGKVEIDLTNTNSPSFKLYFKKSDDLKFNGVTARDFTNNGQITTEWDDGNNTCSCSGS